MRTNQDKQRNTIYIWYEAKGQEDGNLIKILKKSFGE